MTLEEAFYITDTITMSLMLVLMVSLVTAVLVIKSKITHLHQIVDSKVQTVSAVAGAAKSFFNKKK